MVRRDLVLIGGSAGGLETLLRVLDGLPADFPATVLVALHIPPTGSGLLPTVIQRRSRLPVAFAADGDRIEAGKVFVAPPNQHLVVTPDALRLLRGPRENRHRPAIDPLFRSGAEAYGPRVIGLTMSGGGSDGAAGMVAIRQHGGYLIVQRPDDASIPMMPQSVLNVVAVDAQLASTEIAAHLMQLVPEPVVAELEGSPMPHGDHQERAPRFIDSSVERAQLGSPSIFSCPDCGGVLWEAHDGAITRFRCRVGHAYTSESLLDAQNDVHEAALWTALRALEEKADMYAGMAQRAGERGRDTLAQHYRELRDELEPQIAALKELLTGK
jgi:two-component system chemotaxis response regulator CheB